MGGALFQSISRNPLGSPDILGLGQGATAGALTVIVLFSGSADQVALGALAGGPAHRHRHLRPRLEAGRARATGWCWSASASPPSSRPSTAICSPSPTSSTPPARSSG
ncbi:iron chelate uptake ABC transporter family permease subunit [Streptomyces prasinosporus]|uniref:iron chelate uptake ABC transporter family permease subunit n=1 Tax=Streptomyces prasinosporus TaxID=68256 RepID=UPI0031EA7636